MYYSNSNYEAFVHPRKPEGVDGKSAYIVGSGLAGLSAACFLVRDGQMDGSHIHIIEADPIAGGALDGAYLENRGFCCRGGREMEDHMECVWDLFRSIPSLEEPGASVLDEVYYLNKDDPNWSSERVIHSGGIGATREETGFSPRVAQQMQQILITPEDQLADKRIDEVLDEEFFSTPYWTCWSSMFAFQRWHSALEYKRYCQRFMHHASDKGGHARLGAMKFMRYNQYDSFVLPMQSYLKSHNVDFIMNTTVKNVVFETRGGKKYAKQLVIVQNGKESVIPLTAQDLVFTTLGSNVDGSTLGTHHSAASSDFQAGEGVSWKLWKNIAAQDPDFGHPEKFCSNVHDSLFASATVTIDDAIGQYVEKICGQPLAGGRTVTGGIITVEDSSWRMSFTFDRQPHFKGQKDGEYAGWLYALNNYADGDYVRKPMKDCTGFEICEEWLYHMGVPEDQIADLAEHHANAVPCNMPYVTSYFMPRAAGDRPKVVPDGAVNFAFLGEFVEIPRDVVFTTEYAVRSGMEAVYTLLNVERGVPEVYAGVYDLRVLLAQMASGSTGDGAALPPEQQKLLAEKIGGTYIERMLQEYHLL